MEVKLGTPNWERFGLPEAVQVLDLMSLLC